MWFVWLVLGAIVGGWGGAFIGATAGALGGWFASQSVRAAAQRLAAIEKIGVGAGLLAIGYLAPVPPGETERQND